MRVLGSAFAFAFGLEVGIGSSTLLLGVPQSWGGNFGPVGTAMIMTLFGVVPALLGGAGFWVGAKFAEVFGERQYCASIRPILVGALAVPAAAGAWFLTHLGREASPRFEGMLGISAGVGLALGFLEHGGWLRPAARAPV